MNRTKRLLRSRRRLLRAWSRQLTRIDMADFRGASSGEVLPMIENLERLRLAHDLATRIVLEARGR